MGNIRNCHECPAVACDVFQVVNCGQTQFAPILQNSEAASPCAKKVLFSKIQQIHIAVNGLAIARHHIARSNTCEGGRHPDARLAPGRGRPPETPDESEPKNPKTAPTKK